MRERSLVQSINVMLDPGAYMPERAHAADAGADLRSREDKVIKPRHSAVFDTGVHVQIPEGYVGILESKSGLNVKNDITGTGVIDSGYTGPIVVKLYNHSRFKKKKICAGDKIIQLVIYPVATCGFNLVDEFESTERGDKGFGSTGK